MPTNAILCITGSELTRGETRDLNGYVISAELTQVGVRVDEIVVVPDAPELLRESIARAIARANIVILSGGLGPTRDDTTVEVLSQLFGRDVYRHAEAETAMRERARARGVLPKDLPVNYWKQAEVIAGAEVLLNPVGLAPGMMVPTDRGFLAVLPGVPKEMRQMLRKFVIPAICSRLDLHPPKMLREKILGVGESWAEARIQKLGIDFNRLEYGISAKPGELLVKFTAHQPDDAAYLQQVHELLEGEFGEDLIPLEEGLLDSTGAPLATDHARTVHELLLSANVTVATAESCTGGLIAKHLTENAGSSAYYLGSVVAYQNSVKASLLGVPRELLEEHGAVSSQVCEAMARGVQKLFGADYGVATTGIAGPTGGSSEKPVGLVYIGLAGEKAMPEADLLTQRAQLWGDRENVRTLTAVRALDILRRAVGRKLKG